MRSRSFPRASIFLCALAILAGTPPALADSWCRFDDPGDTEQKRHASKLKPAQISELPCPSPSPPSSFPDDLFLPLPCDHFMALRKVKIPGNNILSRRQLIFGTYLRGDDPATTFRKAIAGPWRGYISGGLADSPSYSPRFFYIGKYEVTTIQYEIFKRGLLTPGPSPSAEACAPVRELEKAIKGTQVLPKTDVTWFEATAFASALTEYLIAQDKAAFNKGQPASGLPWVEASPSFLRLPTEVEWEFAAQGEFPSEGEPPPLLHRVTDPSGTLAPPERLNEVASVREPDDGPSTAKPVGRRKPNPLGLYDMLGNVNEMTSDYFRPVLPDQSLGALTAGIVVKGGSILDSEQSIRLGMRDEMALYDEGGANRSPVTGFRLVLTGPFLVKKKGPGQETLAFNQELMAAVTTAYNDLGHSHQETPIATVGATVSVLSESLEKATLDKGEIENRLRNLQIVYDRAAAQIAEKDRRLRLQQLESTIAIALGYVNIYDRLRLIRVIFASDKTIAQDISKKYAEEIKKIEIGEQEYYQSYIKSLLTLTEEGQINVEETLASLKDASPHSVDPMYPKALRVVEQHLRLLLREGGILSPQNKEAFQRDLQKKI